MGDKNWDELDALWRADQQPEMDGRGYRVHARGLEPQLTQQMTDEQVDAAEFMDGLSAAERRLVQKFSEMK